MLEIGKLITLDNDEEYIVSGRADYEGKTYYMISKADNYYEMKVCYLTMEGDDIKVNIVNENSGVDIMKIVELLSLSAQEFLKTIDMSQLESAGNEQTCSETCQRIKIRI